MARRLQVLQGHLQREQEDGGSGIGKVQLSAFQAGPHLVRPSSPVRSNARAPVYTGRACCV